MLLSVGNKVRFIHTGDTGRVSEVLPNDLFMIELEDGDEIPASSDVLERTDLPPQRKSQQKKIVQPTVSPEFLPVPKPLPTHLEKSSLSGVQLIFEEKENDNDEFQPKYNVSLFNLSPYELIFSYDFVKRDKLSQKIKSKVDAYNSIQLHIMEFDALNDYPHVDFECWPVTPKGTGARKEIRVKIKAKAFFKKKTFLSLLNREAISYTLIESFEKQEAVGEDLKTYTKRIVRPNVFRGNEANRDIYDPERLANFVNEIDLHAENLPGFNTRMQNADILRLQLKTFEVFINEAIEVGAERVFVIHGLGKGKLRDMIASRLLQMNHIRTFRNEYHPRYGWGATEVELE